MIKQTITALILGILFGVGLTVSQMVNPAKVLAFLDVAGNWDPTLLLVFLGALVIALPAYQIVLRRGRPLFAGTFHLPSLQHIDTRLVGGSALFGIGWGLIGLCPGPALSSLAFLRWESLLFVISMFVGMALYNFVLHAHIGQQRASS